MSLRILVVDDHAGFRRQASLMLSDAGYDVVGEATDAASAITATRDLHPEVVLVDVGLPDVDGFAVAEAITAVDGSPVVVLISAREPDDYGTRSRSCGARAFLRKADLSPGSLRAVLAGEPV